MVAFISIFSTYFGSQAPKKFSATVLEEKENKFIMVVLASNEGHSRGRGGGHLLVRVMGPTHFRSLSATGDLLFKVFVHSRSYF